MLLMLNCVGQTIKEGKQRILHTWAWSLIHNKNNCALRENCHVTEVRGHCICKEMPVIPVNRVADKKRIIGKPWSGRGGGEAKGVAAAPPPKKRI
jgi:hypothetical protein